MLGGLLPPIPPPHKTQEKVCGVLLTLLPSWTSLDVSGRGADRLSDQTGPLNQACDEIIPRRIRMPAEDAPYYDNSSTIDNSVGENDDCSRNHSGDGHP